MQVFSCAIVLGLHYCILRSHALVILEECGLELSCWKMHGHPWRQRCLDGRICCSKICTCISALMLPSQMCNVPMPWALTDPSYHDRCWLLELTLITAWTVLFLFGPENTMAVWSKNYLSPEYFWSVFFFHNLFQILSLFLPNLVANHTPISSITPPPPPMPYHTPVDAVANGVD